MLQAPVQPLNYSLRVRRKSSRIDPLYQYSSEDEVDDTLSSQVKKKRSNNSNNNNDIVRKDMSDGFDDDVDGDGKAKGKSRRELPPGAVATLKAWLLSPEHFSHPYPTPQDQAMLMQKTGIDKKQLKNWFTNARRRIWKPMLKKQIESGQLAATPAGVPGAVPGLMIAAMPAAANPSSMDNPHSVQAIRVHYQQAVKTQEQQQQQKQQQLQQQQQQQQQHQQQHQQQKQHQPQAVTESVGTVIFPSADHQTTQYNYSTSQGTSDALGLSALSSVSSLGNLPRQASNVQLSKTDSHAVLMELFARDQDLVRQATESARLKAEAKQQTQASQQSNPPATAGSTNHPMKTASSQGASTSTLGLSGVPSMNSWPHFSSITSLNNLGSLPGVKSISSLSGADLSSKGEANKSSSNIAQVKSMESMGKNDSYAFLEVFFGDRASSANLTAFGSLSNLANNNKGKQAGDEDNEIGLSLEDETPSQQVKKEVAMAPIHTAPSAAPMSVVSQDSSGTLKRAYDDALAARGLMSVSRSSEKLTDLVLPAKIQRTLSQEFINKEQMQQQLFSRPALASTHPPKQPSSSSCHQYPGQQPVEPEESGSDATLGLKANARAPQGQQQQSSWNYGHIQSQAVPATTEMKGN